MVAIVHLSDIHLKAAREQNPVLERAEQIAAAICQSIGTAKEIILIISGDTAYSGQHQEYSMAFDFIGKIKSAIRRKSTVTKFHQFVVPGNHDCDFSGDQQTRDILLQGVSTAGELTPGTIEQCCMPLDEYNLFADKFNSTELTKLTPLISEARINVGEHEIQFLLLNSAWMSKIREVQGTLQIPIPEGGPPSSQSSSLMVSVLHHPYKWFSSRNANTLRRFIDQRSDLVLSGHEHESSRYTKSIGDQQIDDYIEGGVLQESSDPEISEFSAILVDLGNSKKKVVRLEWDPVGLYRPNEAEWEPFARNAKRLAHAFEFSNAHSDWLNDPGVTFTHPRKDPIDIDDIYIFPDLKKFSDEGDTMGALVRSADYFGTLVRHKRLLILGEDTDGRTCLAKYSARLLRSKGIIPIVISAETLRRKVPLNIHEFCKEAFESQYRNSSWDAFCQLDYDKRVLLVDDLEDMPRSEEYYQKFVDQVESLFGISILFSNKSIELSELYDSAESLVPLKAYKYFEISPFGHVKRHDLINKWHLLGRKNEIRTDVYERKVAQLEDFVTEVLGRDLIRPIPLVVLTILQQIDSGTAASAVGGSFGQIYDHLVTARLRVGKLARVGLKTRFSFLSYLSYQLFCLKTSSFTSEDYELWAKEIKESRYITFDENLVIKEAVKSGILTESFGQFEFRHGYYYYYFTAKFLADHVTQNAEVDRQIEALSGKLFLDSSGSIFLFLTHLSPSEYPIKLAVAAANRLFEEAREVELGDDIRSMNARMTDAITRELPAHTTPRDNRRAALGDRDTEESVVAVRNESVNHESAAELNGALRTILILGQVLRDRSASLSGVQKEEVVKAAVSLARRSLGYTFDRFEEGDTELVSVFQRILEERGLGDPRRSLLLAQKIVTLLLMQFSFGIIKHLSTAVGSEDLRPLYDKFIRHSDEAPPVISLISACIKLDHYSGFPEDLIVDVSKKFEKNHFASFILRNLVWLRFYLFPADVQLKQRICQQINIPYQNQRFLNPKAKRSRQILDSVTPAESKIKASSRRDKKRERQRKRRNR